MRNLVYVIIVSFIVGCMAFSTCRKDKQSDDLADVQKESLQTEVQRVPGDLLRAPMEDYSEVDEADDTICESSEYESQCYVPAAVSSLMDSCVWYEDTLCVVNGKVYCRASDWMGRTRAIYEGRHLLAEGPTVWAYRKDTVNPTLFTVVLLHNRIDVDFSKSSDIRRLRSIARANPDYRHYRKDRFMDLGGIIGHGFRIDYPRGEEEKDQRVRDWLVTRVNKSLDNTIDLDEITSIYIGYSRRKVEDCVYTGSSDNYSAISRFSADRYFAIKKEEYGDTRDELYPFTLYFNLDFRNVWDREHFVTYMCYTHDYNGGAHGFYTERLISYDFVNDVEIDWDYLFEPGHERAINNLFYHVVQKNEIFREFQSQETLPEIKEYFEYDSDMMKKGYLEMPQPGLVKEGVVFSYQPYEASCFAAGVLHFVIPYDRLMPYLTERAKWCLGL